MHSALAQTGQAEAALGPLRTLHRRCVLAFGEGHPDTCTVGGNLAAALVRREKFSEAESLQLKLLRVVRRMLGPNHLATMRHEHTLAMILSKQRRYSEAEDIQRKGTLGTWNVLRGWMHRVLGRLQTSLSI